MKVVKTIEPSVNFRPFKLTILVVTKDQLRALYEAAGRMTNGHGLELYDQLQEEMDRYK